ncbi:hypothetical protein OC846_001079 [Tilletia horrida]|uniref:Uncharacterized protein n=1 Tax=Tilletia horrida TaxID=155126 RepID=A0AAN6GT94_9BASI|nr:hypothetical protein OC846_001079 [Tilletia horrida]KAK0569345.1 hypothetical protein OC861_001059 [Tilletia horrida]
MIADSVSSHSDPRTPDQVADRSETPPSTGPPVTPLIFRSHFQSPPPAPKRRDRIALAAGLANCMQGARTLLDALESSPIVIQEEAFPTPVVMPTPQLRSSSASEHTHAESGLDFVLEMDGISQAEDDEDEGSYGDDASSLSSAAEALATFFQLQKKKSMSSANAPQQSQEPLHVSETNAFDKLLSPASTSTSLNLPYERSHSTQDSLASMSIVSAFPEPVRDPPTEVVAPVEHETDGCIKAPDQVTPAPALSTIASPASVVITAQRRAWLAQFYPDSKPKLHPHHAQLANLRASPLPIKSNEDHQDGQIRPDDPRSELGSPFGWFKSTVHPPSSDKHYPKEEKKPVKSSPSLFQKSFSNMSFSAHRTGRRRAQSSAALRPPELHLKPPVLGQPGRLRSNSDAPRSPMVKFESRPLQDSGAGIQRNTDANDSKAALSLLDEQVFTPVRPPAHSGLLPFHKAAVRRPATSPAVGWSASRERAHTAEGRVTFVVEEPKDSARPRVPIRSFSSGNLSKLNASGSSKISRLFTFRTSAAQAPTPPPKPVRPSTADQTSHSRPGWKEDPSPAWNQTPDLSKRQRIQSFDTPGMSTDDSEVDSNCSTAPSTPTIPQHMITAREEKEKDAVLQGQGPNVSLEAGVFKPMPLPRVEAQAALRLRPSLRNIRAVTLESDQTSVSTDAASIRSEVLPFRELKASWEARAREASKGGHHPSPTPSQTTLDSTTSLEMM